MEAGLVNYWAVFCMLAPLACLVLLPRIYRSRAAALRTLGVEHSYPRAAILVPALVSLLLALAAARPYLGKTKMIFKSPGRDVMAVVDVSNSMLGTDVEPNRLTIVKRRLFDFNSFLMNSNSGDRIGIVLFSGGSYLFCPLTSDHALISTFIQNISTELVSEGGSHMKAGIERALVGLQSVNSFHPIIALFTDGEDPSAQPAQLGAEIQKSGASLLVFGTGTEEGSLLQLPNGHAIKDRGGNQVRSRLDEGRLKDLATFARGTYVNASTDEREIADLLEVRGESRDRLEVIAVPEEFGWLFLLALLLICAAMAAQGKAWLAFPLLILFSPLTPACATPREAALAYEQGRYESAYRAFGALVERDPDDPILLQGLASSAYRLEKYDQAASLYSQQELLSGKAGDKFRSLYNMGNAQLLGGHYKEAIESYGRALSIKADDEKTHHNMELARKLLEQQESRESRSPDQQDQQNKQEEDRTEAAPEDRDGPPPSTGEQAERWLSQLPQGQLGFAPRRQKQTSGGDTW